MTATKSILTGNSRYKEAARGRHKDKQLLLPDHVAGARISSESDDITGDSSALHVLSVVGLVGLIGTAPPILEVMHWTRWKP